MIPWRRKWQPTPVFWPGEFCGQRSLAGYSPLGRKESDMTKRLTHYFAFHFTLRLELMDYPFLIQYHSVKIFMKYATFLF